MGLKISGGLHRGRPIKTPKGDATRPTSDRLREAFFNIVQNEIDGAHFLDLFAGSGAMGLEALSRGAKRATLIERARPAHQCIKENLRALDLEKSTTLLFGDAYKLLKAVKGPFDITYIDPPYKTAPADYLKLLKTIDESDQFPPGALVFVEENCQLKKTLANQSWKRLTYEKERRYGVSFLHSLIISEARQ